MDNVNLRYVLTFITLATEVFSQYLSNDINGGKGPRVVSMAVRSDILYRFAETVVTSTVVNELYDARETTFDVNLPMDAFTSNFTLEVDGVSYNGEVKEKQQARQTYDKAKRKGQTAAHMFYNNESREITALRIPPVRNDILENAFGFPTTNELALVERPSPRTAYIRYNPSPAEQARDSSQGISGMFKVQYDVERSLDAGDMYIVDGYFVHFFAPVGIRPLRKRILFVLDVSGSMSFGRKIMQVKEAMTQVLTELKPEDLFNIVTFESISHAWSPTMRAATMENLVKATDYVQNLKPLGGTNVNDAMIDSIKILQDVNNVGVDAPIIVFLTDGDPTVGVTNFGKILNNVDLANREKIQIFSLAFGEDANFAFLKKISARNNAFARKIYVDSDATLQLTGFYNEISNVLLSKISFTYLDDTVNLTTVTQTQFPSFFEGSELVISGQLNELDDNFNAITMQVIGSSKTGVLEMSATTKVIENSKTAQHFKTRLDFSTIVKKTWAYLTIKKLLLEELKTENHLLREDLRHDAVRLAIKFNFVTPVTSMVVIKPEEKKADKADHNIQEDDAKALDAEEKDADPGTAALNASGTKALTATLKDAKALADSDPHFIVNVKGQFLHRNVILKKTKNRKGKLMGRLRVSGNIKRPRKVMATLGHRLNMATNSSVSCWMVQHNGGNLLDGNITDYLLRRKHSKESSDDDEDIADDVETEGTTFSPDVNKQTFNNEIDVETEGLTTLEADSFDKDVTDTLDYDDELNEDDENSEMISLEQDEKDNDIESDDTGSLKM
ncbi:ITIH4-like protein [Mya arenaria]|uniref:ITIH4-like protein n=1 Tax=Mya arenaria TaxID=6604 RepID=A0ABY7FW96_MYAAR|nr:ITIH4-like protein [Mya arenaria]